MLSPASFVRVDRMPRIDFRIDDYIRGKAAFAQPILRHLRARLHAVCPELEETIRWSMPSFTYKGRPLASIAAFKAHASFGFWDREALLGNKAFEDVAAADREGMGLYGKLTSLADLPDDSALDAQIRAAAARAESADRPKRPARSPRPEAELPAALAAALAEDEQAKATWIAFPPGCRREYCEWIGEAKREETRAKRVAESIAWLRQGKRRNWKYETC